MTSSLLTPCAYERRRPRARRLVRPHAEITGKGVDCVRASPDMMATNAAAETFKERVPNFWETRHPRVMFRTVTVFFLNLF